MKKKKKFFSSFEHIKISKYIVIVESFLLCIREINYKDIYVNKYILYLLFIII